VKINKYLIGIDEVGRGPLAGPVAVGAFVFLDPKARRLFSGVKESKQLTEEKREEWFKIIGEVKKKKLIDYCVSFESHKVIDEKGLTFAINRALKKSLESLEIKTDQAKVWLDGGLKAPKEYKDQKTFIKGDENKIVIALASICAKVLRDRKMVKFGKIYPQYGFKDNKGYGTKEHYEAIKKYGILEIHRRRFLRKMYE
jgi:ribonuclease HII